MKCTKITEDCTFDGRFIVFSKSQMSVILPNEVKNEENAKNDLQEAATRCQEQSDRQLCRGMPGERHGGVFLVGNKLL